MTITRDKIVIERPAWEDSLDNLTIHERGMRVWTPCGKQSNLYSAFIWKERDGANRRGLVGSARFDLDTKLHDPVQSWIYECFDGRYYYPLMDSTWRWINAGTPSAADDGVTHGTSGQRDYGGGLRWWKISKHATQGWITFVVPAGTRKVFVMGRPGGGPAEVTCTVEVVGGTRLKSTLDFSSTGTGDFGIYNNDLIYKYGLVKVAENFTDAGTLTIRSDIDNEGYVVGVICVGAIPSNPFDGVFDPETGVEISIRMEIEPSALQLISDLSAAGWWSQDNWAETANQDKTLILAVDEITEYINDGTMATWAPAENAWTQVVADAFRLRGDGVLSFDAAVTNGAAYSWVWLHKADGVHFDERWVFNAQAVAGNVKLSTHIAGVTGGVGGYCGIFGLTPSWSLVRQSPIETAWREVPGVGGWDDSWVTGALYQTGQVVARNGRLLAIYQPRCQILGLTAPLIGPGRTRLLKRSSDDGFLSINTDLTNAAADVAVENGTDIRFGSTRLFTTIGSLEPVVARR